MRRRLAPLCAIAAAALSATSAATAAGASFGARRYQNEGLRIAEFKLPRSCDPAPPSPYPGVLLVATCAEGPPSAHHAVDDHAESARLLLSGQRIPAGSTALDLASDARAQLAKQGFADPQITPLAAGPLGEERVRLDAAARNGRKLLRQAYVVEGDVLIVLTLVTPSAIKGRAMRDFEMALASLLLRAAEGPSVPPTSR